MKIARFASWLLPVLLVLNGCMSRNRTYHGGVTGQQALTVVIASIEESSDSPAGGYPSKVYPLPHYPFEMARAGITGEVDVKLRVGADGLVKNASIVRSSQIEFEASVLQAVAKWRFRAMQTFGQTQSAEMTFLCRIKFVKDDED
ncbi:MAG TPA: energy transducer TonB [Opitutaceae bacterium]|nr:energy transducer TonB [Opitutaceae bacterium]